jgi:hypothetical protein
MHMIPAAGTRLGAYEILASIGEVMWRHLRSAVQGLA